MIGPEDAVILDTPEKYRPMAKEILPPLLELLRARSALEGDTWERSDTLRKNFIAGGGSPNQLPPGSIGLDQEFRRRYLELVQPRCVPGFLKYGAANSYASPAKYGYLDTDPGCQLFFTMKSTKRAVVELRYTQSTLKPRHRFTLKPGPEGWLIAKLEHGYQDEDSWHIDHYL